MRLFRSINDLMAVLLLTLVIPGLWILNGAHLIELPPEVSGGLIAIYTLIAQYYWRTRPPADDTTRRVEITEETTPPSAEPSAPV